MFFSFFVFFSFQNFYFMFLNEAIFLRKIFVFVKKNVNSHVISNGFCVVKRNAKNKNTDFILVASISHPKMTKCFICLCTYFDIYYATFTPLNDAKKWKNLCVIFYLICSLFLSYLDTSLIAWTSFIRNIWKSLYFYCVKLLNWTNFCFYLNIFISFKFECLYGCCNMEWDILMRRRKRHRKRSEMKNGCLTHMSMSDDPIRWTHATKQRLIALETRHFTLF